MGVPMVQTKKRRSSLVMGLLLAVLLGVAAGFFVLAMPIHMLETVTTLTRLSKLMVQAEPPISPNDRTLLAVLAGILTAGIGWVLVDWLLFGRAGMSTLIRTREDDYEDEDEDAYRPTDPLDLVTPMAARGHDWSQDAAGDTRRPLSARNDIGEPSPFAPPPPFGQILPGAGVSAPPLQPNVPPLGQPTAPPSTPNWAVPAGETGIPALNANFDLPDRPAGFPAAIPGAPTTSAPPTPAAPPANMPSWLPAPGARADAVPAFGSLSPAAPAAIAPSASAGPGEPPAAAPDPFAAMPSAPPPLQPTMAEPPQLILSQPAPPLPMAPAAPAEQRPYFTAGSSVPPGAAAPMPPIAAAAPVPTPPQPAAPVIQAPEPVAPAPPVAPRPAIDPGVDRARLQDLLAQLEAKVHARRAAVPAPMAPAASAAPTAPAGTFAPAADAPAPAPFQPQRTEPPAAFVAPQLQQPLPHPPAAPVYELPPAQPSPAFNLGIQPQLQPGGPAPMPSATATAPIALARIEDGQKDELLDQPLHVTLDLLRNMVRR